MDVGTTLPACEGVNDPHPLGQPHGCAPTPGPCQASSSFLFRLAHFGGAGGISTLQSGVLPRLQQI